MEDLSSSSAIALLDGFSVGKLVVDVARINRIHDSSVVIFKLSPEPRKMFESMIEFGSVRAFRGSDLNTISLFDKKVASFEILLAIAPLVLGRKMQMCKRVSKTRRMRFEA